MVGMYLVSISDVDLRTSTFFADFYFWFLWGGDHDPTVTYEFTNGVGKELTAAANFYAPDNLTPQGDLLPDGRRYQAYHVQGRFLQPFRVRSYPFNDQTLVIGLEDLTWDVDNLIYDVDHAGTRSRPDFKIQGWNPGPLRTSTSVNHYPSDFGDPRVAGKGYSFSRVEFAIRVHRPGLTLAFEKFFPIVLVMIACLGAFMMHPRSVEGRLTLTVPGLLAAVALQLTTASELPPRGHIMLIDEVYLLAYLGIVLIIGESLLVHRLVGRTQDRLAKRVDIVSLVLLGVSFFGGLTTLILLR